MRSLFATKFILPQLLRRVRPPERRVTLAAKALLLESPGSKTAK